MFGKEHEKAQGQAVRKVGLGLKVLEASTVCIMFACLTASLNQRLIFQRTRKPNAHRRVWTHRKQRLRSHLPTSNRITH